VFSLVCLYEANPALYDKSHTEYRNITVEKSFELPIWEIRIHVFVVFVVNYVLQYGQCDSRRKRG